MNFLEIREVTQKTKLSRHEIDEMESIDKFPRHRLVKENTVSWIDTEVNEWIKSREVVKVIPRLPNWNLAEAIFKKEVEKIFEEEVKYAKEFKQIKKTKRKGSLEC